MRKIPEKVQDLTTFYLVPEKSLPNMNAPSLVF